MEWKLVKSERGPEYKIFSVRFDYKINPRNGKTVKVIVLESQDSVNVVAVSKDQKILFIRQHRFGTGENTLELPGGLIDPGEDPLVACKRELREETGYTGTGWQPLGKIGSNPVYFDNYVHHFTTSGIELSQETDFDEEEAIEPVMIPVSKAKAMLFNGKFDHPHTVNALIRYFGQRRKTTSE
ncbi:MAG: NUDIX hydrolase [Bacteroidota bacterium]